MRPPVPEDTKIGHTTAVAHFEAAPPEVRARNGQWAMIGLESVHPEDRWHDQGPLWAQILGVGWWDSWPHLRSRVIAARNAALIETGRAAPGAAPESVAAAAASGAIEGLTEGARELGDAAARVGELASGAVKNADALVLAAVGLFLFLLLSKGVR